MGGGCFKGEFDSQMKVIDVFLEGCASNWCVNPDKVNIVDESFSGEWSEIERLKNVMFKGSHEEVG